MISTLHTLAAKWEERGQTFHDKHANKHPMQANAVREAMRMCAQELREVVEGERKEP